MKILLSILAVFLSFVISAAEEGADEKSNTAKQTKTVYKWVDKNGKVHFSDTPREDAEPMVIRDVQSVDSTIPTAGLKLLKPKKQSTDDGRSPKYKYKNFSIVTPQHDQALWSNDGIVEVEVSTDPELRGTDYFKVTLDGEPAFKKQKSTKFNLTEVIRGTHTLKVDIYDRTDRLLDSVSSTFHVHKQSAKRPNRGNN
ncbi:uncharacterized protein DUF4124 [Pleionea mediterranea]|uniref:Uncharacterized protein DUF4124 n=2 Tax=Pleionea mediterranea TaxID=523701 RepID=A0A316GE05_9GAMM|nr:uncharacterized protein DUF4124 [Pleionea mediterranea]